MGEEFIDAFGVKYMPTGELSDDGYSVFEGYEADLAVRLIVRRGRIDSAPETRTLASHAARREDASLVRSATTS